MYSSNDQTGEMFGKKKLAKRSIIGTRVSALSPRDGRFYSGAIQSQVCEDTITSPAVYAVKFDNGGSYHIKSRNIVGPGFQTVSSAILKRGQKVFLTLNGREVCGFVLGHDRHIDEVVVGLKTPSGEDFETTRMLEDIRLLESRKSARLVDHADSNYSKLADFQITTTNETYLSKRRIPSHVIDVPTASSEKNDRFRRQRCSPDEILDTEHTEDYNEVVTMDETVAAMVLTSLSVSPSSPSVAFGHNKGHLEGQCPYRDSHLSSSVASSGFYSGHSERDDHSPPLPPLSESAPAILRFEPPTPRSDDDSSSSSGRLLINEENEDTLFKCTWRGCSESTTSRNAIERHIRRAHFDRDSDLELTDNEEDFHYMEVDLGSQSINTITKSFAAMQTSSPSEDHRSRHVSEDSQVLNLSNTACHGGSSDSVSSSLGNSMFDHDYQRKILRQSLASSVPASGTNLSQGQTTSLPIAIDEGQIQRSLSWHIQSSSPGVGLVSPPQRPNKLTPQERLYQHQAQSPKSSIASSTFKVTQHRRARSEVRKCRKVYGMENRDQWCTQCKWKKACTRFIE